MESVFNKLDKEGFALKLSKCEFSVNRISWLGFDICENGYEPKFSKIQAVLELKPPHSLKQLRSYMEVFNHLQKFLSNLHILTEQFRPSLKLSNKQKFVWGTDRQKAFEDTVNLISTSQNCTNTTKRGFPV